MIWELQDISGPSAKDYLNGFEHLFSDNEIKLTYKKYGPYLNYKQLMEPFESGVSILDLIAHIPFGQIKNYLG
jgi:hypothetical protein